MEREPVKLSVELARLVRGNEEDSPNALFWYKEPSREKKASVNNLFESYKH